MVMSLMSLTHFFMTPKGIQVCVCVRVCACVLHCLGRLSFTRILTTDGSRNVMDPLPQTCSQNNQTCSTHWPDTHVAPPACVKAWKH